MLRGGDVQEITELRRQGLSITQIGTLTGFDRKTIRKYLGNPKLPRYGPRPKRGSRLEPFRAYLDERLAAGVWNAVVLLAELKERGYAGGYTVLKDYLRPLRRQATTVAVRRHRAIKPSSTGAPSATCKPRAMRAAPKRCTLLC